MTIGLRAPLLCVDEGDVNAQGIVAHCGFHAVTVRSQKVIRGTRVQGKILPQWFLMSLAAG